MKKVVILGSTGSIGENALKVVRALPSRLRVVGLSACRNTGRLLEQAREFEVDTVAVADPGAARSCSAEAGSGLRVLQGESGLEELAALDEADIVLCSVVGMAGLKPVLSALDRGRDVALATKEVLVAAGAIVARTCRRTGARLLPVDSEHSAVFQCLAGCAAREGGRSPADGGTMVAGQGARLGEVKRIILTASGGPFMSRPEVDLESVTPEQALAHPRWRMGSKVTVDSATLMNKGLEMMEAHWLFGVPLQNIDIMVHPESIVHSMVEFVDGTLMAQMSLPDMRFAIQYALTYPDRVEGNLPPLDLASTGALHFFKPDEERFPCLSLAREAAGRGGSLPAVLNAANEVAVGKFVGGELTFPGIWRVVARVTGEHRVIDEPDLEQIVGADAWARREAVHVAAAL